MKAENRHICQRISQNFKTMFAFSAIKPISSIATLALTLTLVGCSGVKIEPAKSIVDVRNNQPNGITEWKSDGLIVISRMSPAPQTLSQETLLGFFPGSFPSLVTTNNELKAREGKWLVIDRNLNRISLNEGGNELVEVSSTGLDLLPQGTFSVVLKQRSALWHAPDSYFSSRNLPVPPVGDLERFRKGALGEFVVFLDKETPLHSGPVALEEIGGAKLNEDDLAKIYYQIETGTPVEIR